MGKRVKTTGNECIDKMSMSEVGISKLGRWYDGEE